MRTHHPYTAVIFTNMRSAHDDDGYDNRHNSKDDDHFHWTRQKHASHTFLLFEPQCRLRFPWPSSDERHHGE